MFDKKELVLLFSDNAAAKDIYLALANCYRLKGQQEQSIEATLNSYKEWKKLYR